MLDRLLSKMGLKSKLETFVAAVVMVAVLSLAWEWLIKPFSDLAHRNNSAIGATTPAKK